MSEIVKKKKVLLKCQNSCVESNRIGDDLSCTSTCFCWTIILPALFYSLFQVVVVIFLLCPVYHISTMIDEILSPASPQHSLLYF